MTDVMPLIPRPLDPLSLPKEAARANLAERLVSQYQFAEDAAAAIARIVVNPEFVRKQLDHPYQKRFPGGKALFVYDDVFTPGVSISPINPRETEQRTYPIATPSGEEVRSPLVLRNDSTSHPVLTIGAKSRRHVQEIIAGSIRYLQSQKHTPELSESIKLDTVLEPATIALARIKHDDDQADCIIPIAIDGSTRTMICHDHTGFNSIDVIYKWPNVPVREWRGKINQILAIQDEPASTVTEQQEIAHRALTYPARILIGVQPLRNGPPADTIAAYRAIVGGIHVGHPAEWPIGSAIDQIADSVLDELLAVQRIPPEVHAYMAGLISPEDLERHGFSEYPDVRAASIVSVIFNPRNREIISRAFRKVMATKTRLGKDTRTEIAVELIMRAFRSHLTQSDIRAVRSILQRTISLSIWGGGNWTLSGHSLERLLDEAQQERSLSDTQAGPSTLELGLLATYWLIAKRALTRETRKAPEDDREDNRSGAVILTAMMKTDYGLLQLYHAIIAGRKGEPIYLIEANGRPSQKAGGGYTLLSNTRLRDMFSGSNAQESASDEDDPNLSPTARLDQQFQQIKRLGDQLMTLMNNLEPIVHEEGLPSGTSKDLATQLQEHVVNQLNLHAMRYSVKHPSTIPIELDEEELFDSEEA
jgi:hypothetical protein